MGGLNGNRVAVSTKSTDHFIGCTADGKWVIYKDWGSYRLDKGQKMPEMTGDADELHCATDEWDGFVEDLYRYEVATGQRQRFAVVRSNNSSSVSPDGKKVLLGNRHNSVIEMPEPKWEKVWLSNEWNYGGTFWFADSSGIATMIWGGEPSLAVEFFGKDGWAKEFGLKDINGNHKAVRNFSLEAVDKDKRLYLTATENYPIGEQVGSKSYFYRCEIKKHDLFCKATWEFDKGDKNIGSSALLPNGDYIFSTEKGDCIYRLRPGQTHAECIVDTRYGNDAYEVIHLINFSPDGKRMAFRRGKPLPEPWDRAYSYQYDLFVKELSED